MRTNSGVEDQMKRLIATDFIPAISDGILCSPIQRRLVALPAKLGGLCLPIFSEIARDEFKNSCEISKDQKDAIIPSRASNSPKRNEKQSIKKQNKSCTNQEANHGAGEPQQLTSEYQQRLIDHIEPFTFIQNRMQPPQSNLQ